MGDRNEEMLRSLECALAEEQERVKEKSAKLMQVWNVCVPPGTEVIYEDNRGNKGLSKTRSKAWMVGGEPVALIEGKSGGIWLMRLEPITRLKEEGA